MNKELARELLFDIDEIFEKYNIVFWLDAGTLLGAVREKDFIELDADDVDIGVYESIFLDYKLWHKVVKDLEERNIKIVTAWGDSVFSCKKFDENNKFCVLDVHTIKEKTEEYVMEFKDIGFYFPKERFNQLDEIEFQGRLFKTPHAPKEYLEELYGDNWKEPRKDDTIWKVSKCSRPLIHEKLITYSRNIPIFKSYPDIKLSIVMTAYKKTETLPFVLASLARQKIPYDYEIVILNDYLDNDGTKEICDRYKDKLNIRYLFIGHRNSPENIIRRATVTAMNIGVKQAKGDIVIINSPEVLHLENDAIMKLVNLFEGNDNKIVAYPANVKDDNTGKFLNKLKSGNEITKNEIDGLNDLKAYYAFCIAFRKENYVSIGGGDEDFKGNAFDDADLYNRLKLSGCRYVKRDVKVLHLYHQRLNYKSKEIMEGWNYNKKLYEERKNIIVRNKNREWGEMDRKKLTLSIIMPSYLRPKLLDWGLFSLSKQIIPYSYEIIVLNDGIEDETKSVCDKYKDRLNIRYIFTGQRNKPKFVWRIPGFAINIGVKQACGEIIILTCPEIYLMENNVVEQTTEPLLNNSKLLVIPYGRNDVYGKILKVLESGNKVDFSLYEKMPHKLPTWLPFFIGMRKDNFLSIGGYDEDFSGYAEDDLEIIHRLRLNGSDYHQIQAHIIHLFHTKNRTGLENKEKQHKHNKDLLEAKKNIIIRNKNKKWGVIK